MLTAIQDRMERSLQREMQRRYEDDDGPLDKLPDGSLLTLASILTFPPSVGAEDFFASKRRQIAELRPESGITRTPSLATFFLADRTSKHKLCMDHIGLKPELMGWLLWQLARECSTNTDKIRAYAKHFGDDCPEAIKGFVDRMSGLPSLWINRKDLADKLGPDVPANCIFDKVKGRCAACVLSVVGARAQTLIDLRASLKSHRSSHRGREHKFLPLIEIWIDMFRGRATPQWLRDESDELRQELLRVKRFLRRYNQEKRRAGERKMEEQYRIDVAREKRERDSLQPVSTAYYRRPETPTRWQRTKNMLFGRPSSSGSIGIRSRSMFGSESGDTGTSSTAFEPWYDPFDTDGLNSVLSKVVLDDYGRAVSPRALTKDNPDLGEGLKSPNPELNRHPVDIPARTSSTRTADTQSVTRGRRSDKHKSTLITKFGNPSRSPSPNRDGPRRPLEEPERDISPPSSPSECDYSEDIDNLGWEQSDFPDLRTYEMAMDLRIRARVEAKLAYKEAQRAEKLAARQREQAGGGSRRAPSARPASVTSSVYSQDTVRANEPADHLSALPNLRGHSRAAHGSSGSSSRYSGYKADYETIVPPSSVFDPGSESEQFTIPPSDSDRLSPYPSSSPNTIPSRNTSIAPSVLQRQASALDHLTRQLRTKKSYVDVTQDGMPDMPSLETRMQEEDVFRSGKEEEEGWETDIMEGERDFLRRKKQGGNGGGGVESRFRDVSKDDYGGGK